MSQDFRLKYSRRNEKNPIQIVKGLKMPNSSTYKIYLEDHTIGDLLRIFLLKNEEVKFAGYKVPHPLEDNLQIKVQTIGKEPNDVVNHTLKSLQKDLFELQAQFDYLLKQKQNQM